MTPAMRKAIAASAGGLVLASAAMLANIKGHEGREYTAYRDIVGVWTVCDGITGADVVKGKTYTDAECNALSIKHVEKHGAALLSCINVRVTQGYYDAMASWAYNVGAGAACGSTAVRLLNAGQYLPACHAMMAFNKVRDTSKPKQWNPRTQRMEHLLVVSRGLNNRRAKERDQCIQAIPAQPKATA